MLEHRLLKVDEVKDREISYFPIIYMTHLVNSDPDFFKRLLTDNSSEGKIPGVDLPAQVVLNIEKTDKKFNVFRIFLSEDYKSVMHDIMTIPGDKDLFRYLHQSTLFFVQN